MNNSALDFFDDLTVYTNLDGEIIDANSSYLNIICKSRDEVIGEKESDVFNSLYSSQIKEDIAELLKGIVPLIYDEVKETSGNKLFYKTKKELIQNIEDECKRICITRRDITQYQQYLDLYNEHKVILKHIAKGESLQFALDEIIKSVEARNPNMIGSILLLDDTKKRLLKGAAPSLPDFYSDKLNGMEIGEDVGSCGAAVFLKKRVIVSDISTHENWKYAKNLAAKVNLHACWSQPFFSSTNEVLGSFAIYYDKPKKPTPFDIHLIEDVASITGIAVERSHYQLKLKKEEEERKQQEQLLMHKSKQVMMGEMLENIAHQWRQPLSVISTCATGVLMNKEFGLDSTEVEEEAFEMINLNAQYLSNTIDNFRKYFMSKGEKVEFKIKECLDHTMKLIDSRIKYENINIVSSFENISIFNYENELTQVFMNIFNNSIDVLAHQDEKNRYIFLDVYKEDDNVVIQINDSGNGMDESMVQRVFEPYFTTKHKDQGTGIGLYMSQEIIEKHMEGTISVKNNNNSFKNKNYYGLEFTIKLPLCMQ